MIIASSIENKESRSGQFEGKSFGLVQLAIFNRLKKDTKKSNQDRGCNLVARCSFPALAKEIVYTVLY
jgi:hypothetical protein